MPVMRPDYPGGGGGGGAETVDVVAGETLAAGDVALISAGIETKGRAYKTDGDSVWLASSAAILGIVTVGAAAGATATIQTSGTVTGLSGLTAGKVYGLSSTAGALATTASTPWVGVATASDEIMLSGLVTGLSSLVAGDAYGSNASGVLTSGLSDSVGYAISDTTLQIRARYGAAEPQAALWPAPLYYYRFASDPGTDVAADSSGNGFDGTLTTGAYNYQTATFGGSSRTVINWTGNGNCAVPTLSAIPSGVGSDISFSFWLKFDSTSNAILFFAMEGDGGTSPAGGWQGRTYNNGRFRMTTGSTNIDSATQPGTTDWHHYVFTQEAAVGKIYVNGALETTSTIQYPRTRTVPGTCTIFNWWSEPSYKLDGQACEIAMWNGALTAAQVNLIYGGGTPPVLA
jgi:hypothetical protein